MRIGLLGPAAGSQAALAQAAHWLKDEQGSDRVVYLGPDRMLEAVVGAWAEELVGPGADDASILNRATRACLESGSAEIDAFLSRERERTALRMFESLPGEMTRSVDLIGGKVAVMLYDKAHLEEEDILPATLLLFGKSRKALIKQVGRRWFLSPGSFPHHGIMVLDDADETLRATSFDRAYAVIESRELEAPRKLVMRVVGEGNKG